MSVDCKHEPCLWADGRLALLMLTFAGVPESLFEELKRYVRFGKDDEDALRALGPHVESHFRAIANDFYARLEEHEGARAVFSGPAQVERLKGSLCEWMHLLVFGPWDEAYYLKRARIGRVHVRIQLPQRYMFGAMNLIRVSLQNIARAVASDDESRIRAVISLAKILDIELAIMLETYREAFVDKVQELERLEKDMLASRLAIVEARYEEIVETAWSLISTFDQNGTILLFNKRCEEITGLGRADAIGRDWYELFLGPAERARVRTLAATVLEQQHVAGFESSFQHRDGSARRVRWHLTTLPSGRGPVLCALGSDITEEHALGTRTRLAERLAALGTMAAGLAHEIRNPLNAAHLQLTLLRRKLARPEGADVDGARSAAELAGSEITRLAKLVEEFLRFARPQPLRLQREDLRATVRDVAAFLSPESTQAGVALVVEAASPCVAEYDDERLRQVLLNLVRNAIEAVGEGGRVVLRLRADAAGPRLEVEDDGPGLPTPDAPVFEPFYTTKEAGTGLGLAIVHRIVDDHGGQVTVDSRPGRTVFTVTLPPGTF